MNELQVAYQAFSFFLEETHLGDICTPGVPFRFCGNVMDTQGGGAELSLSQECRDLGSGHRVGAAWLWNLGRLPDQGQQGRT